MPAETTTTEPPCTCGRGTMFYSYLHTADCPFSRAGVLPPQSREELLSSEVERLRDGLMQINRILVRIANGHGMVR